MSEPHFFDHILESLLTEEDAFDLIHAIRAKFGMVGTEFCRSDIESAWDAFFASGATDDDFGDKHWDMCLTSRTWVKSMQDRMTELGSEIIFDVLIPEIMEEMEGE